MGWEWHSLEVWSEKSEGDGFNWEWEERKEGG